MALGDSEITIVPCYTFNTFAFNATVIGSRVSVAKDTRSKKPVPPGNTIMVITRIRNNTGTYGKRSANTLSGTIGFVNPTHQPVNTVADSGSELGALTAKARRKAGSGPLNAAVAVAEGRQTIEMINNRIRSLIHLHRAIRKSDWGAVKDLLRQDIPKSVQRKTESLPISKRVSNLWLEYSLGWRPFIQDIYGGLEALQKGLAEGGQKVVARTGQKSKKNPGSALPLPESLGPGRLGSGLARSAGITGAVSNPGLRTLQEYGLLNPAALAWEKLPYSFVIDWIIPIGDLLSALTYDIGLTDVRGWAVTERRVFSHFSNKAPYPGNSSSMQIVTRHVIMPGINVLLEKGSFDNLIVKTVTGIALLRQRR